MLKRTMTAGFGLALALLASASAAAFDPQGRLLIGTEGGVWRSQQGSQATYFDGRFLSADDLRREQNDQRPRPPIKKLRTGR